MTIKYDGTIKKPQKELEYSEEQIKELIKCHNDINHFFNYVKIVHPDYGRVTFKPYDFQKDIVDTYTKNRFLILLLARQVGKCVFSDTYITIKNKTTGIIEKITIGDFYNRLKNKDEFLNCMDKFIDVVSINDYKVLTENGWENFTGIGKTVEYQIYELILENGNFIKCADDHIVIDKDNNEILVKNVTKNDYIKTKNGTSKVKSVNIYDDYDNMYDLLNVKSKKYYTNDILSHNSTVVGIIALWYAIFNNDKLVGITSYVEKEAIGILDKIKIIYEELPEWLKPGVKEYNKKSICFENGSIIRVSATTKNAFRGKTLNCIICDELAFVPPNQAEDFWSSNFPTISKSTESKVILISTPKGQHNLFHRLWVGATNKRKNMEDREPGSNGFVPIKYDWRCLPERDDKWAKQQKESLGSVLFRQEHSCISGKEYVIVEDKETKEIKEITIGELYNELYSIILKEEIEKLYIKNFKYNILTPTGFKHFDGIYKQKKDTVKFKFNDGSNIRVTKNHRFNDKYATNLSLNDVLWGKNNDLKIIDIIDDNKFVDVYDPINVVNNLYYSNNVVSHNCEFLGSVNTVIDADILKNLVNKEFPDPIVLDLGGKFRVYKKPQEGCDYCIGVDTSKGTGENYSAIQVLRIDSISPIKLEQVAVYECNRTDPYHFANIVNRISIYYNNAYIMVENNAEGWTVASELHWNYENSGLINSGSKSADIGIRATKKSKNRAVILMKKIIENNLIEINDYNTVVQLTDFTEKANGSFSCNNLNDDLLAALWWAVYILKQDIFDENMSFKDPASTDNDEGWGMLADIDDYEENWSWL